MAVKKETAALERVYNVPLRREYLKVQYWRRTEKAVTALRQFLQKHMKSNSVKMSREVNEALWNHGIRNPPHHLKITATKNDKGEVMAQLFGHEAKVKKVAKKVKEKKIEPPVEKLN